MDAGGLVYEADTAYGHYEVVDAIYNGRPARVLYSGQREAAQSGEARDDQPELLFDYNQRFLELALGLQPRHILLIGGGAYTLPKVLLTALPSSLITVVEIDAALFDIAKRFFNFVPNDRIKIHHSGGRWFLDNSARTYDLILIDAFIHSEIPENLRSSAAAKSLAHRLRPDGVAAINMITAFYGARSALLFRELTALQTSFKQVQVFPASHDLSLWIPQNLIITTQNGNRNLDHLMRYEPLELPNH